MNHDSFHLLYLLQSVAPTHDCCDNCSQMQLDATPEGRPHTPQPPTESGSEHTTPSKSTNANGKRKMERSKDGLSTRRGQHLQDVRGALEHWRFKTKRDCYSPSSVTAVTILPDPILTTLASNARIRTIDDIESSINPPWIMARRHGGEILLIMKSIDDAERETREQAKQTKAAERKRETAARQAERKREMDEDREEKRKQKERDKAERRRLQEEDRAAKQRQRDADRAAKQCLRDETKPKRTPRQALAGSSVFNAALSTPFVFAQVRLHLISFYLPLN
jgi:hypothetical protein